ncbi:hypothetical protein F2Q68_00004965 [Brassica cretica]|uniref:Uncharacterized protein n=2 Tax=Brassica cretica TaxID=69181 RepID=A0A8S9JHC0_BRACR|nr:hypothetical protein F2Q68_00004965 [Brassica cretica]KAF3547088.1 hypothetical protein DY000_02007482 [Brassica cretica]
MGTRNERRLILLTRIQVPLIDCTLVPLNCPMIIGSNNQSHSRAFLATLDPSITSLTGVRSIGSTCLLRSLSIDSKAVSIDSKAVSSIDIPSSPRQLPLTSQT